MRCALLHYTDWIAALSVHFDDALSREMANRLCRSGTMQLMHEMNFETLWAIFGEPLQDRIVQYWQQRPTSTTRTRESATAASSAAASTASTAHTTVAVTSSATRSCICAHCRDLPSSSERDTSPTFMDLTHRGLGLTPLVGALVRHAYAADSVQKAAASLYRTICSSAATLVSIRPAIVEYLSSGVGLPVELSHEVEVLM
jgi:hypothetical protein